MDSIRKEGLVPDVRQYVHLSQDEQNVLAASSSVIPSFLRPAWRYLCKLCNHQDAIADDCCQRSAKPKPNNLARIGQ